jgi:hypothetical protein
VANDKKSQSPEELGEAVGKKIEELFGGMFDDGPTAAQADEPPATEARKSPAKPGTEPAGPSAKPPAATTAAPAPRAEAPKQDPQTELIEQIEALVLNLEWEISVDTVRNLLVKFKEMERLAAGDGTIRFLLNMNNRVLQRVIGSESAPKPALIRFLQDTVSFLKMVTDPRGRQAPEKSALVDLKGRYQNLMAETGQKADDAQAAAGGESLIDGVGTTVRSLEEISHRLARILAVLRQGGNMSGEEITRRLGTLEKLLAQHVGKLTNLHGELSKMEPLVGGNSTDGHQAGPEGLALVSLGTTPLAIPSSVIEAQYPLGPEQIKPIMKKSTVTIGSVSLRRLPLKMPKESKKTIPTILIHLSWAGRNYFLLADRSLGYRRAPAGTDLLKENRIKIGAMNYVLLNPAAFRSKS